MAISEATRLRAPGVDVTLADGKTYSLIFDFEALCILEEELGGLDVFTAQLQARGWPPGRLKAYRTGMLAALSNTGLPRRELIKLLVFKDLVRYAEALTEAFNQAMPELEESDSPNPEGSGADSPGNGSTRLPPPVSAVPTPSSGG